MEPWLVIGDRLAECRETDGQEFDPVELDTRFFERAIEFTFDPINCSV